MNQIEKNEFIIIWDNGEGWSANEIWFIRVMDTDLESVEKRLLDCKPRFANYAPYIMAIVKTLDWRDADSLSAFEDWIECYRSG